MVKVAVLGAGGGVGQALSLQLRLSLFVDELALYDRSRAVGVAVDLSHIPVKQIIEGYKSSDNGLRKALTGADIVIVTAGPSILPPGVTFTHRNDLLTYSGPIIASFLSEYARTCPKALIMIVSNPVNALIPFAAEILRKHFAFDARRLLGVTTLDVVRAETFVGEKLGTTSENPRGVEVDVIGGHSAETMVPLFSRVELARNKLSSEELDELVYHTRFGGVEVFLAKDRKAAATLSTAFAAFRMAERACRALKGEKGMQECSFIYLPGIEGGKEISETVEVDYFSAPVELGVDGAARIADPLKGLSEKEREMVEAGVKQLREDIKLGSESGTGFGVDIHKSSL